MKASMRTSLWLAATLACAVSAADTMQAGPHQLDDAKLQLPRNIEELIVRLENWLDREGPYPPPVRGPAAIRFVGRDEAISLSGQHMNSAFTLRGFYDAQSSTIYLVTPWMAGNMQDAGVLLHELVHHRQQTAKKWECPNAQELDAYRLQDRWLRERGLKAKVSWLAVIVESSCTAGAVHYE